MTYIAHEETYKGLAFQIVPYMNPENPRTEYDNCGAMICFHGKYSLGDDHGYSDPLDAVNGVIQEIDPDCSDFKTLHEALGHLSTLPVIYLPLYLYDHSGITMSTTPFSCPWDSGQVGFIYITHKDAQTHNPIQPKESFDDFKERWLTYLRGEVQTYDQYLAGDVYGYLIFDGPEAIDHEGTEAEVLESVWGFYGEDSAITGAKEAIDAQQTP
jgi:hypothetical protein